MRHRPVLFVLFFTSLLSLSADASSAPKPPGQFQDLNTSRNFPEITTEAQWRERAREIRQQILVSSGLWPMPEKTPLHAVIFGKIVRDGYSIEKVYFQTYPGFYLAGNLYRPVGKGEGPFPAVLNPHGHWENGRMADTNNGSIPGRCINFARQGMIAFSYDMVGYNDTHFPESPTNTPFYKVHRNFATNDPANLLWSISLMGLQTWNSIRALDFLESLPDADPHRFAVTGESGGGTQTFMLGAIDDRLAAQAPVVMVSHTMQGGCSCENMPGLRVEFSNMEIAAAAAPRPQIMVGASGDWTKTMLTVEGPAVAHIYELLHAPENLRYVRFDFPHNYNQTSRESVYQWFNKCLLSQPDSPVKELAFQKEPDQELRVFPDGKLPADAVSQSGLIQYLARTRRSRLQSLQPHDQASWQNYQQLLEPAWKRTLHLEFSTATLKTEIAFKSGTDAIAGHDCQVQEQTMTRRREDKALKVLCFVPGGVSPKRRQVTVVLVDPAGRPAFCDESGAPKGLARKLLDKDYNVIVVENSSKTETRDETSIFFNTYNRTSLQNRVQDLITICQGAGRFPGLVLCGTGRAGLWCLLAAPAANAVIADCDQLDVSVDQNLLAPGLFSPGLRNIDTFVGAPILAAPHPLLIHNVSSNFPTDALRSTYKALKAKNKFQSESRHLTDEEIVAWISRLK